MRKKYFVLPVACIALIALICFGYASIVTESVIAPMPMPQSSVSPTRTNAFGSNEPRQTPTESSNAEVVTKIGTMDCLPAANTAGPQTMECALGMKLDDGNYYALAGDSTVMMGIATGQRIEVVGSVSVPTNTKYNMLGTIMVQSLRKL